MKNGWGCVKIYCPEYVLGNYIVYVSEYVLGNYIVTVLYRLSWWACTVLPAKNLMKLLPVRSGVSNCFISSLII